jgi:hypothetical protein
MSNVAIKVPVVESEAGWGRKIDDWMVVLSMEDAKAFEKEFNAKNTATYAPAWYMQVEGIPQPIDLSDKQMRKLKKEKRMWLSELRSVA